MFRKYSKYIISQGVGVLVNKKFYWLKLKDDFFNKKEIKRLRRIAGGDTYTVIYLKMLLLSLKENGDLFFDDIGDDFIDELSLELDEDSDNVKMTISYLESKGLLEVLSDNKYHLSELPHLVGYETDSAARMREHRKNKSVLLDKPSQCDALVTTSDELVTTSDTEKEIEIEKELKTKEKNADALDIFNHYISKDLIKHQDLTTPMKSKIVTALKNNSVEGIKKIIDNYTTIVKSDDYYFTAIYRLEDILRYKDLSQFKDESLPFDKFRKNKAVKTNEVQHYPTSRPQDTVIDINAGEG